MSADYYESRILSQRQQATRDVMSDASKGAPDLIKKVESWLKKTGSDRPVGLILRKISSDELFAAWFAKDPVKQKMHEILAYEHLSVLQSRGYLTGLENLPSRGDDAKFLDSTGQLQTGDAIRVRKIRNKTKSVDFKWCREDYTVYAMHKYTKESGGSQDNQFKDLELFAEYARENRGAVDSKGEPARFVIIGDGPYYSRPHTDHRSTVHAQTKLEYLDSLLGSVGYACTIMDLG